MEVDLCFPTSGDSMKEDWLDRERRLRISEQIDHMVADVRLFCIECQRGGWDELQILIWHALNGFCGDADPPSFLECAN